MKQTTVTAAEDRLDAMRWREMRARIFGGESTVLAGLAASIMSREQLEAAEAKRGAASGVAAPLEGPR